MGTKESTLGASIDRIAAAAAWLLLMIGFAGCASTSVQPPTATEIETVKQQQLAIVLFQVNATIDGKAVDQASPGDPNNAFRIYLAKLDELQAPQRVQPPSLSGEAAGQGWRYLKLPPGVYYLLVLPPGFEQNPPAVMYHARAGRFGRLTEYKLEPGRGGFWSPELMGFVLRGMPPPGFIEIPGFWFDVPANKEVAYLGSLSVACKGGRGLFGSLIDSCDEFEYTADARSAKQLAASTLPGLAVDVLSLGSYGKPREGTRLSTLGITEVLAHDPSTMTAAFVGAELAPWATIGGTGQAVAIYNLLAIGVELATRAGSESEARARASEAQPCIDRLSKEAAAADYSTLFAAAFAEAAHSVGTVVDLDGGQRSKGASRKSSARHRMTTSLPILRLRESGQAGHLALEVGLNVRLEALDEGGVAYYNTLLYAPELSVQSPFAPRSPLYMRLVSERARERPMSEWCGPDGPALLKREIAVALKAIAVQLARDLN